MKKIKTDKCFVEDINYLIHNCYDSIKYDKKHLKLLKKRNEFIAAERCKIRIEILTDLVAELEALIIV